jgi:hypothetical protein
MERNKEKTVVYNLQKMVKLFASSLWRAFVFRNLAFLESFKPPDLAYNIANQHYGDEHKKSSPHENEQEQHQNSRAIVNQITDGLCWRLQRAQQRNERPLPLLQLTG